QPPPFMYHDDAWVLAVVCWLVEKARRVVIVFYHRCLDFGHVLAGSKHSDVALRGFDPLRANPYRDGERDRYGRGASYPGSGPGIHEREIRERNNKEDRGICCYWLCWSRPHFSLTLFSNLMNTSRSKSRPMAKMVIIMAIIC